MPPTPKRDHQRDLADLLRDLLIVQLGVAGVPQVKIRAIVGGGIGRVNEIVSQLKVKGGGKPDARERR